MTGVQTCALPICHFQQNDAANQAKFTKKIDYIIQKVSETGCKVIVNDMCWNCNSENFFRKELSRLAEETGGLYVSAQDAYGAEMLKNLSDGVHPGVEGHITSENTAPGQIRFIRCDSCARPYIIAMRKNTCLLYTSFRCEGLKPSISGMARETMTDIA